MNQWLEEIVSGDVRSDEIRLSLLSSKNANPLHQILNEGYRVTSDRSDTCLSPLSLVTRGYLNNLLKNDSKISSDKGDNSRLSPLSPKNEVSLHQILNEGYQVTSDRSDSCLSPLSLVTRGGLNNLLKNDPKILTDKTDKLHLSGLSGENQDPCGKNLENISKILTDKPDTEIQSIINAFEERCAIVEYDGGCSALEAERTAYQEAFINVLSTYYGDNTVEYQGQDWLDQRSEIVQAWLANHLPLTERR